MKSRNSLENERDGRRQNRVHADFSSLYGFTRSWSRKTKRDSAILLNPSFRHSSFVNSSPSSTATTNPSDANIARAVSMA